MFKRLQGRPDYKGFSPTQERDLIEYAVRKLVKIHVSDYPGNDHRQDPIPCLMCEAKLLPEDRLWFLMGIEASSSGRVHVICKDEEACKLRRAFT